ncbi:MAG: hypothetical protein EVJ47_00055 [Candidatus Acidulodesulfobacterium ferriphilum]|uniref:Porin n=1 Tax=Candidatus Acidulodesulfobacterium ferriphilum TaxID=2597223 RepID=A0A519BBY4_9DELT|nr:MAG: hypothetical protein EVJ47_00055 [Candidatus Acidulodesulfobacterium ferriphilum]
MRIKLKLATFFSFLLFSIFLTAATVKNSYADSASSYFSNIQLLGTLVSSYTYNFAKSTGYNGNYGDNWQSDGFAVNNADITLRRSPGTSSNPYGVGFHISLDFGQNIQFYKAYYGNLSYFTEPFQQRTPYDIRKAYININLPVGSGLDIHIGKENELLGFEAFNPIRNWNDTYSLLDAAEPSTLTGVFFTYNFIPQLTSTLGIANTINAVSPIDNLPVIELNESYTPVSPLTFNGGFIYGANSYFIANNTLYQDNLNKSVYSYIDAQYSPTNDWSFVLDYELGLGGGISNSVFADNGIGIPPANVVYPALVQTSNSTYDKSRFSGIAGYIHHQQTYGFGQVAETLREVAAYDQNGLWEMTSTPGTGYTYIDSTLTLAYTPSFKGFKNIQFRFELEHQGANHDVYLDSAGNPTHSQQNTMNLMVLYSF